jgi:hypothetical protein
VDRTHRKPTWVISCDPKRTFCAQMSGDDSRLQKESMSFGATSI